jgi:hypothetical protein
MAKKTGKLSKAAHAEYGALMLTMTPSLLSCLLDMTEKLGKKRGRRLENALTMVTVPGKLVLDLRDCIERFIREQEPDESVEVAALLLGLYDRSRVKATA